VRAQVGRRLADVDVADLQRRIATAASVTIDLGAGNGRFVLERAAGHPEELVLAIDADRAAMAEASRRAARRSDRGGVPNALFLVAALEALPGPLAGVANLVTVHFPWGSLLAGATGADPANADRIAALCRPGGQLRLLLASAPRDEGRGARDLDPERVVAEWSSRGFEPLSSRPAELADADEASSGWGRRLLRVPRSDRRAWRIELRRRGGPRPGGIIGP